ncbi:MAG: TlpA family protein disulfide reductase [Bacteroidetes bacterium]|jgi:thiol-disulfide isomerase/thioredoxin|nr:TlpA family protein disulfide reductase [Bacteroidota bacterium]
MRKLWQLLLVLLLFLCRLNTSAQDNNVTLSGFFDHAPNGDIIQVCKPVGEYFNIFYTDKDDEIGIKNNTFIKQISVTQAGFIRLQCKDLPKFACFVEPGNEVSFRVKTEKDGSQQISFSGPNAKGNELFINRKLLNNGANDADRVNKLIQNAENEEAAYNNIKALLSGPLQSLEQLKVSKEITDQCYNALKGETEQRMLFWCMSTLDGGLQEKVPVAMDKANLRKLMLKLFTEFDPFNAKYRNTVTVANTMAFKCYLTDKGILNKNASVVSKWAPFSSSFAATDSYFAFFDEAPADVQQFLVGNDLLIALTFKPMSDKDYIKIFKSYMNAFPQSPYIPVITNQLMDKIDGQSSGKNTTPANENMLRIDSLHHVYSSAIPQYQNLTDLIKDQFKGKPVFVDFWATYCSPCIAEFKYSPELKQFLQKKGIALLYVSIDSEGSENYWQQSIKNYQLEGYHYFCNASVRKTLAKQVPYIPRYMIFNAAGRLVESNAYQPSDKQKLYNQIENKLGI